MGAAEALRHQAAQSRTKALELNGHQNGSRLRDRWLVDPLATFPIWLVEPKLSRKLMILWSAVSEPGAVATGSRGTSRIFAEVPVRSLPLPVLTTA